MAPLNHDVAAVGEEATWGKEEEGAGDNGWMNGEGRARREGGLTGRGGGSLYLEGSQGQTEKG